MTGYNLPPGCRECDIPGNRPEDGAWEEWWNLYSEDLWNRCKHDHDEIDGHVAICSEKLKRVEDAYDNCVEFTKMCDDHFETWMYGDMCEDR